MNISRKGAKAQRESRFPLRLCAFAGGLITLSLLSSFAFAQEEIAKVLEQAGRAADKDKVQLFQQVIELADRTPLNVQERREMTSQFVKTIKSSKLTMEQTDKILGPKAKKQVARQISYRRSVEQWHIIHPLRFTIVWDCPKGEEPTMRAIQAVP